MASVTLNTGQINDWHSFHEQSAKAFGFPAYYGNNLNAFIDCLTYLPEGDGMSGIVLGEGEQLIVHVPNCAQFALNHSDIWLGFIEAVSAVNQRYVSAGSIPRLVLVPQ